MNVIYFLYNIINILIYSINCSILEVVCCTIKFLVFYIPLYRFVNMIFIHWCVFVFSDAVGGLASHYTILQPDLRF